MTISLFLLVWVNLASLLVPGMLAQDQNLVVSTVYGQVRGTVHRLPGNGSVNLFFGIPYAASPTGSRRFLKPSPPAPWSGIRNATQYGPSCPQVFSLLANNSEDCLYVNVFTPQVSTASLPVMIFIHGGAYILGSGQLYDSVMIARKGVVAVTFNYRLGALGYLSTEDAECPGNNGMLDQVFALQWVRDNIAAFGGNASRITIFGESAGSTSVSLHLLSPLSKGLFHGALMESGVSLSSFAIGLPSDSPRSRDRAFQLGVKLGCSSQTSQQLLNCLRKVDAKRLVNTTVTQPLDRELWYPVVETINGFLPDTPVNLIKANKGANVPTLRGTNTDEEVQAVASQTPGIENGVTLDQLLAAIQKFVDTHYPNHPNKIKIASAIQSVYAAPANVTNNSTIRTSLIMMLTDFVHTAPTTLETLLSAQRPNHAPLYMYLFGYRSQNDQLPLWMGAPHGAEVYYVFGFPFIPGMGNYTDADRNFTDILITLWTNFAKSGNPTPQPVAGITWPAFTMSRQSYLFLGNQIIAEQNIRPSEMKLWNEIIPHLTGRK